MKWQAAQDNCQDKFDSASGRLFEPRSTTMNLAVLKAADKLLSPSLDVKFLGLWLGITDLKDQGTYRYDSNDEEVVDGMWSSGQPAGDEHDCVEYFLRNYPGEWYDSKCSWKEKSICEEGG